MPAAISPHPPDEVPLSSLLAGGSGRVVSVGSHDPCLLDQLGSMGLVPGTLVTMLQRRGAFVVKVGETMLAMDARVAHGVLVQPDGA